MNHTLSFGLDGRMSTSSGLSRLPMATGTAAIAADRALRNTKQVVRAVGVYSRVRDVAAAYPDRTAVVTQDATVTYVQLCRRVRQVQATLIAEGCGPGDRVAVLGPRGIDTMAAFLAMEIVGAIYLSVDPEWPVSRIVDLLHDVTPRCVLQHGDQSFTAAGTQAAAQAGVPVVKAPAQDAPAAPDTMPRWVSSDEQRYILHTSGSTGRAKGVVIVQSGMVNHLWSMVDLLRLEENDTVAFTASPGHVISIWQMLASLLVGGRVVILDDGEVRFGRRLMAALVRGEVTVLELVPTVIGWLIEELRRASEGKGLSSLRCLLSTGETLRPTLATSIVETLPSVELLNAYGTTECSDDVTLHPVREADLDLPRLPAGRPLPGVALYLLVYEDGVWRAAEPGEVGELWVGGACVGGGYVNNVEETRARFFHDDFDPNSPTGRIYRTGDLAEIRNDTLYCLGRADRQLNVAGLRMESEDIEAAIAGLDGISQCAVLPERRNGQLRLTAYYVATRESSEEELRARLAEVLPPAMIPTRWVRQAALPLNGSGKIDYRSMGARASLPSRADGRRGDNC